MAMQWYYDRFGESTGSISGTASKELASAGEVVSTDFIWRKERAEWIEGTQVKGLFTPFAPIRGSFLQCQPRSLQLKSPASSPLDRHNANGISARSQRRDHRNRFLFDVLVVLVEVP